MTLPNFLIIGAAKSGTTAIYTYIKQHPQIFMSDQKELRYFSYFSTPPEGVSQDFIHPAIATTLDEYQQHFSGVKDEKIIGESSPTYLYTPGTAERIRETLPNVKLLAILRNPVERAYSSYTHAIRDWKEPARSFEEALELEEERIKAGWGMLWHYKKAGLYHQQLMRYFNVFDNQQIKIVLHDDLVSNDKALLTDIFHFLGVEPSFQTDTGQRPNVSGFPKSELLHKAMKNLFMKNNLIKRFSRILFPAGTGKNMMTSLRKINLEKRPMPERIKKFLIDYYQEDVYLLQDLISRDLSSWLE